MKISEENKKQIMKTAGYSLLFAAISFLIGAWGLAIICICFSGYCVAKIIAHEFQKATEPIKKKMETMEEVRNPVIVNDSYCCPDCGATFQLETIICPFCGKKTKRC